MPVTIDELNVDVALVPAAAAQTTARPQAHEQPDLRKTLAVIKERMRRLDAE